MSDLYSNTAIREHAELIVRNEIHHCVSYLVSQVAGSGSSAQEALGVDYEDDLMPILECLDWDEAASEHLRGMDADELREYLTDQDVEFTAPDEDKDGGEVDGTGSSEAELRALAETAIEAQGASEFCRAFNVEPERSEVFEHWIVSNWLASELEERGHPVAHDFLGLTIWGRPTTGQGISLDAVILEIARDALA